jgi:hypothetical protein
MRERIAVSKGHGRIAFTDAESLAVNLADLRVPNALPKKMQVGVHAPPRHAVCCGSNRDTSFVLDRGNDA